jgi:hypothetical protein
MGNNTVDCCHHPGSSNQAADGISHQFMDALKQEGDGHDWSVDLSWVVSAGLVHDIWSTALDDLNLALHSQFVDEPIFLGVIDAMHNINHGKHVRDKRCVRHRMLGYQLEDGCLWRIGDGKST